MFLIILTQTFVKNLYNKTEISCWWGNYLLIRKTFGNIGRHCRWRQENQVQGQHGLSRKTLLQTNRTMEFFKQGTVARSLIHTFSFYLESRLQGLAQRQIWYQGQSIVAPHHQLERDIPCYESSRFLFLKHV